MRIKTVGVIGAGFMGAGIVQVAAQSGYGVVAVDASDTALSRASLTIAHYLGRSVSRGRMTAAERDAAIGRIKFTLERQDLSGCDLVIEAVTEDLALKKKVFADLDKVCGPGTILASNTSCLPIVELAAATGRPDRVLGLHFTSPVPVNPLLEIVRSIRTSDDTISVGKAFGESLGKQAIVVKDTPGFIFNSLLIPWQLNAIRLLESGIATAEDIDRSMTVGLSYPIGPLALADFNGVDVVYYVAKAMYEETGDPRFAPPTLLKRMVAAGWLGRKTGKGFYDHKNPLP